MQRMPAVDVAAKNQINSLKSSTCVYDPAEIRLSTRTRYILTFLVAYSRPRASEINKTELTRIIFSNKHEEKQSDLLTMWW